jgi:hypothetical protein
MILSSFLVTRRSLGIWIEQRDNESGGRCHQLSIGTPIE